MTIHLRGASLSLARPSAPPLILLDPTDLDIPSGASIAILGGRAEARTGLLRLLARRACPDTGVIAHDKRVSPILNDERLLHPALSVEANLRFVARAHRLDDRTLVRAVDAAYEVAPFLADPVRTLDGGVRRALEAAVVAALDFDLILLDDAQQLPPPVVAMIRQSARDRGAGFFFASAGPRVAKLHADLALLFQGSRLTLETDPHSAAARIERAVA